MIRPGKKLDIYDLLKKRFFSGFTRLSKSERKALASAIIGPRGHSLLPGGFGKPMLAVGPWSPTAVHGEGWRLWDAFKRAAQTLLAHAECNSRHIAHAARDLLGSITEPLRWMDFQHNAERKGVRSRNGTRLLVYQGLPGDGTFATASLDTPHRVAKK